MEEYRRLKGASTARSRAVFKLILRVNFGACTGRMLKCERLVVESSARAAIAPPRADEAASPDALRMGFLQGRPDCSA